MRWCIQLAVRLGLGLGLGFIAAAGNGARGGSASIRFELLASFEYESARGFGTGVSASDYDGDGDIDLFVPTGGGVPHLLLENAGDGNFRDVSRERGLAEAAPGRAALWLDGNGDGRLDLFVAGDVPGSTEGQKLLQFYAQGEDGAFSERSATAGFDDGWLRESGTHLGGLCAGDVNNDGTLDVYVTLWHGGARLYLNQWNGRFKDVAAVSRLRASGASWQPVMADFDGDGWTDIYEARDLEPNALWMNQRDLVFRDEAFAAGTDNAMNDMGVAIGDYDNDGDFDLYATTIERVVEHAVLLRNDSSASGLRFSEKAHAAGVFSCGWGWGCTFLDADNDGWLDLAVTNGWDENGYRDDRSFLYRNRGGGEGVFDDVSESSGFNDALRGSSLIAADLDNDGDLDLVQTCLANREGMLAEVRVLRNVGSGAAGAHGVHEAHGAHWLTIRPRMPRTSNPMAIGAIVRITSSAGKKWSRIITTGGSFMGQEPAEASFGLGDVEEGVTVTIEWPDGTRSSRTDVRLDQAITISSANPNRFLRILPNHGAKPELIWHGGQLEEWSGAQNSGWRRVRQPPNPFFPEPQSRSNPRIFRVSDDW